MTYSMVSFLPSHPQKKEVGASHGSSTHHPRVFQPTSRRLPKSHSRWPSREWSYPTVCLERRRGRCASLGGNKKLLVTSS